MRPKHTYRERASLKWRAAAEISGECGLGFCPLSLLWLCCLILGFVCHRAWGGPRVPQVGQGYHWNPELRFQSSTYLPKVRGTWNPSPKGKGAEFLWPSS